MESPTLEQILLLGDSGSPEELMDNIKRRMEEYTGFMDYYENDGNTIRIPTNQEIIQEAKRFFDNVYKVTIKIELL